MDSNKRRRVGGKVNSKKHRGLEHLEARYVLDSTVVFNEIMYNPAQAEDAGLEWVEFYNQLVVDIDISDWVLEGGIDYTFPDKTRVPGRGHIVLASDPEAFEAATGIQALGPWTGRLSNGGEELRLYNNDQRLMNSVDYSDGGDWPAGPDGSGVTLAKRNQFDASEKSASWTFSPELGGTPGRDNFLDPNKLIIDTILPEEAPVSVFLPSDDSLGTSWTAAAFDDASWTTGTTGVGYDTRSDYVPYFGLNLDDPGNGQDPVAMKDVNSSLYMRIPFTASDMSEVETISLRMRYDDGFVAYINGQEVLAVNAPGRNGEDGSLSWDSIATRSNSDRVAVNYEDFNLTQFRDLFVNGDNILAIHALNRSNTDSDFLMYPIMETGTAPDLVSNLPIKLNEIAAGGSGLFFAEIQNVGTAPVDVGGVTVRIQGAQNKDVVLPQQTIAPGEFAVIRQADLGVTPEDGDMISLISKNGRRVLDSQRVDNQVRGLGGNVSGRWAYPSATTPGAANQFDVSQDIVINEIMYSAAPYPKVGDVPATYDRQELIGFDWDQWRYNAAGQDLGVDWAESVYQVDGDAWKMGQGLIGYETATLDEEIRTELTIPTSNDPRFLTYYFQTDFDVTADMLAGENIFELYHFIDDGAVFHLNGQEFYRYNMPDGEITFEVDASRSVSNADKSSAVAVPKELLKAGTNVLSIDVHLSSTFSNDVVMGAQIVVAQEVTPLIPGSPYRENPEEWVELYNKGTSTVDVSGWQFDDGMNFEFPAGTSIPAGGYLVVSNDAATLRQKYPDIQIVGNFGGSLSNAGENIRLVDANKNIVDSVHYYDSGKWPQYADGGASSLELINPNADNNNASVWAASDESSKSEWIEYSYKGISLMDATERSAAYNEFIFGLLDVGEFLLDDVSVKENPSTEARELLQNGSFEADTLGESPATWRLIGNHSGTVVADPTNPENQVLHVVATGAQAHIHDHAETTFEGNRRITDGTEYEISFRAKWVAGNGQLNNRLFFGRLSNTAVLDIPRNGGTPGAQNGSYQENTGPTYSGFQHTPATPLENQEVTVRVQAADSDGVQNVKLFWREDRGEWNSADMTLSGRQYQGTIPGFSSGTIVQFYVKGTDSAGNVSTFPADGTDSRALYQVEDGRGPASPIDKFRLVMMRDDQTQLFASKDRMSNWRIPVTVVHNNDVYYNVVVRMTGSRWIRPNSGYRIDFNPDEPLYGVHESVRFDLNGMAEIVMKQMLNRAGGSKTSSYDDIAYLVSPNSGHTHEILLNLARYENVFLDSQFENGSEGTKYELDDVTYPTSPSGGVEGFKTGTEVNQNADIGVDAQMFAEQGQNPEFYRPHVLIKSNRTKDDYDAVVRMATAIHNDDPQTLFDMTNEAMDVDLWMRHYAHQAFFGNWDTYGFRRPKNLRMYVRPEDDRMIPLMWDCDLCNFSEPLFNRSEPTSRLDEIRAIPHNLRLFWGHMHDFVDRSFNEDYVAAWAPMFGALANNQIHGGDETFTGIINSTRTRSAQALREISRAIPEVDFSVTTADFSTDSHSALLEGKGWVNVRTLKIAGIDEPIDAYWPTEDGWQFEIPVAEGANTVTVEAYDFRGNRIGSDSVTITGTSANPILDSLRITEVHFNPADPSPAEVTAGFDDNNDFEFIEIANVGSTPISLDSVSFQQVDGEGVEFAFAGSGITQLEAGQRAVIVEDTNAFAFRYGDSIPVAGGWSGGLGNGSEQISLFVEGVLHQQFTYDDGWYPATDGDGSSLEVFDTAAELDAWQTADNWRASLFAGGTPGTAALIPGDANRDGVFNSDDLLQLFQNGEFEDDVEDNSTFEEGDWNGDGDFTTADLVVAFQYGAQFNEGPGAGVAAVADRSKSTLNPDLAQQRDLRAVQLDQIFADEVEQRRSVRNNKISGLFGDDEFGLFLP